MKTMRTTLLVLALATGFVSVFSINKEPNLDRAHLLDEWNEGGRELFGSGFQKIYHISISGDDPHEHTTANGIPIRDPYDDRDPSPFQMSNEFLTLDDIVGQKEAVSRIRTIIKQFKDPSRLQYFGGTVKTGMLLSGPPGTGKTRLAQAIANELGYAFHSVAASNMVQIFVGQGAQHVREVFEVARRSAPSVLFIDEIDAIASARGGEGGSNQEFSNTLNELLVQMNKTKEGSGVIVITATNVIEQLDPAFKSPHRFEIVDVPLPTREGRKDVFEYYMTRLPHIDLDSIREKMDQVLDRSKGFSHAQIAGVVNTAIQNAVMDETAAKINLIHLEAALIDARESMKTADFGSSTNEYDEVSFDDIVGLEGVIQDLDMIVEGLKKPEVLKKYGLNLPKGILLHGPPGTGKTMLARALANESDCAFFYASASSFDEKFVGVGAKRVRDIFEKARRIAPSIIFIDEVDGVARSYGDGGSTGTINELLTQMDGFKKDENVIVIAATNEINRVDYRLRREGRFTHMVNIPLPDEEARRQILEMYIHKIPNVDKEKVPYDHLVMHTTEFNAAGLKALVNEASSRAFKEKTENVTAEHFEAALNLALKNKKLRKNYRK